MKKILYTVCSANHLAHCKTMTDAFLQFHQDYEVIIGLVDRIDGRFDASFFQPCELVEAHQLGIQDFEQLAIQYTILELNCAMKVFMAQYIFRKYNPHILLYLDSDIDVMHPLNEVEEALDEKDFLLTPHFLTPLPDADRLPRERDILRSGIYNAGFMAFRQSAQVDVFLNWWAKHMRTECFYNFAEGMGVDQLWLNLVPLFFDRVGVWKHPGANVAYWNIHERSLSRKENVVFVNKQYPLLFLHISGYQFNEPEQISRHQNRYTMAEQPVLAELLNNYRNRVMANGYENFSEMQCVFAKPVKKSKGIMKKLNSWLMPLGIKLVKTH